MAKVLVIEDNPANLKLAVLFLEHGGYEVLQAGTAEDGIKIAQESHPDIILMDIQLPGIDGLAAARLLKQDQLTSGIKIIALTAFAMEGDKEKIHAAGCDAYIGKPIRIMNFKQYWRRYATTGSKSSES